MDVIGISVRTTNELEADPTRARIPGLWGRFHAEEIASRIPDRAHPTRVLGVYTDYESDHRGAYTLVVGCPVNRVPRALPEGFVHVAIPEDVPTFRLEAKGDMPAAVIDAWRAIWRRFENGGRAYTTDYEVHDLAAPGEVTIHVATKEPPS